MRKEETRWVKYSISFRKGVLCVQCGGLMEDLIQEGVPHLNQGPGYPRTCTACKKIENYYKIKKRQKEERRKK